MGKASRNKGRGSKPQIAEISADAAVEWLEALPTLWVLGAEGEFAGISLGLTGLTSPVFETAEEAQQFAEAAGLSLSTRRVGPLAALMQDMASAGVVTLIDEARGVRASVACRLDEVSRSTPSYLVVGSMATPKAAVLRTGRVMKSPAGPLYPWTRFDLTDAAVAATQQPGAPSPFPTHQPGAPLWEQRTPNATPLFSHVAEHGPWPTRFGTFAFFTDQRHADQFVSEGACGNIAWVHLVQDPPSQRPRVAAVPCLLSRIMELLPAAGATPFVINTGAARADVAFGTIGQPYLRTVAGVWEVLDNNHFRYLHPWSNWSREDTFHWAGGPGISISVLDRSFSPRPAVDVADLAEEERDDLVDRALTTPDSLPPDVLDGYLLVLHDVVDQCRSTWLVFSSHTACCGWLQRFEQETDLPARLRGLSPTIELGFPAGNSRAERAESEAFKVAVTRAARKGLIEPYRTQDGHDLSAMGNTVLRTQRVHAAGYIRDLAVEGRGEDGWLNDLVDVLGPDGQRLLAWLDETDALRVDSSAARELRQHLGANTWDALDLRSRHFLTTAQRMLEDHRGHEELDLSAVAVECCKALEVELSALVSTFRDHPDSELPHDPDDWNDKGLRGFLDGSDKLTLGSFGRLLRPKEGVSPLRLALSAHIRSLPGGDFLTHRKFASSFLTKVGNKRNPASHDTPTGWSEANDMFQLVIGGNTLQEIVRWKGAVTLSESSVRSRLHEESGHLRGVVFRFDQRHPAELSDPLDGAAEDSIDAWLEAADSLSPELGAQIRQLARSVLDDMPERAHRKSRRSMGLPVFQRCITDMMSEPLLERLEVPGLIGHDDREIAWRIIPGLILGRTEEGIVVPFALAHSGIEGDAHDIFRNAYDEMTIASMAAFLADPTEDVWVARRGGLVLQRAGSERQPRLTMLLRRNRPPGGYLPVHLAAAATDLFSQVITDLAAGRYGPLAKPSATA